MSQSRIADYQAQINEHKRQAEQDESDYQPQRAGLAGDIAALRNAITDEQAQIDKYKPFVKALEEII